MNVILLLDYVKPQLAFNKKEKDVNILHTNLLYIFSSSEVRNPRTTASWGPWSSWSQCSYECLPGESQARTRTCSDQRLGTQVDLKLCLAHVSF